MFIPILHEDIGQLSLSFQVLTPLSICWPKLIKSTAVLTNLIAPEEKKMIIIRILLVSRQGWNNFMRTPNIGFIATVTRDPSLDVRPSCLTTWLLSQYLRGFRLRSDSIFLVFVLRRYLPHVWYKNDYLGLGGGVISEDKGKERWGRGGGRGQNRVVVWISTFTII